MALARAALAASASQGVAPLPASDLARVVVDTNVWLDLYLFADIGAQPLAQALSLGQLRAVRCAATDAEYRAVLGRAHFGARLDALTASAVAPKHGAAATQIEPEPEQASAATAVAERLLQHWRHAALGVSELLPAPWQCSDPSDQKFLDLAFSARAALLLTKDRHLLRLARPAGQGGLRIVTPRDHALPRLVV